MLSELPPLRIGSCVVDPPVIMAPMAAVSESPYRIIALELGAGLTPTELVSAKGLILGNARTETYLTHDPDRERLLTVQLYGGDPGAMAEAAAVAVARGAVMVDVNMGCPVKKVTKNQAGSALMLQPERAERVVRRMVDAVTVPVTAKMRSGWDDRSINAPELGRRLVGAGASALALHARTRAQGYAGHADWSVIARLKAAVGSVPVIANGDLDGPDAADRVVRQTGCDAVMVGRAALGNPWVFRALAARRAGVKAEPPSPTERVGVVLRHLAGCIAHHGDENRAIKRFRQHLSWYARGLRGAARFRETVMRLDSRAEVEQTLRAFFEAAEVDGPEEAAYDARVAYG